LAEKFNWCPVTPTVREKKPFGQQVEGLSHVWDKSCAVERKVQTHDFQDLPPGGGFCAKPFLLEAVREFKHLLGDPPLLLSALIPGLDAQLQFRDPLSQLRVLGGEGVRVDLLVKPEVQQRVLLTAKQRKLAAE
jgi:hypothetical protein